MSIKISAMPADASLGGSEMIPVSDAGVAKRITPTQLSAYTVDQIEAITAGTAVTGADGVLILQSGALKPVDIDLVCQHAIDTVWGKAAEASPDNADVMAMKDGGTTEKTITLAVLAEYVRSTIQAAILAVHDLDDGSGALASGDYLLVTQGTTAKQIKVSNLTTLIFDGLAAIVAAYDAVVTTADADILYCLQGGVAKKMTLAQIISHYGSAIDGSGTAAYIATWTDSDTLQAGFSVALSAAGFSAGLDTEIPTAKTVRDEMNEIINDATDIGAALADADTFLVDDGGAGTQKKSTVARLTTYVAAGVISQIIPAEVDGTLATGANADFAPTKLVYNKTCSGSDGDDVIDLHDGAQLGQIVTVYLGTKSGSDGAVITPVTAVSYSTITFDAANEIATLQWQGATVGWAVLYTNGTVA